MAIDPQLLAALQQAGITDPQIIDQATKALENYNKNLQVTTDHLQKQLENLEQQQKFVNALSDEQGRIIEKERTELDLQTKRGEILRAALLDQAKGRELDKKEIELLITIEKQLDKINERKKDLARAEGQGKVLANLLGIDEANKNSLTYQMFANPAEVFDGFKGEVEKAGGYIQGFFLSTAMKIQEMTVQAFTAYDMAASSLAKVAGANEQLQSVLSNTARGATAYGISFEQAGRAIEGLYTNLNTFSDLNKGVQEQLTISVAKLDKLGISSQESSKQIGTLSQIMGMSEVQAAKTSEELAGFALAIGKSPQQISQDFAGASNQLAGYGKNMVNVFKDLEIQSKATGVAVGDLIGITEKFQTFEGAATAAGKLNAALGGGFINAMELLEASAENPAAAIDLLRTRLDDAGLAFEEMSFYEQKMIVDAGGFKSIEEASRILSMTNAEREKAAKADAETANSQKLLNEAIQRSIPLQEKLTMIMVNFGIVMGPVVDFLSWFLSLLAEGADTLGGKFIVGVLGVVAALAMLFRTFNMVRGAVSAAGGWMNMIKSFLNPAAGKAAEKAGEGIGKGIEEAGKGGMKGAPGIATAGAALIEFGLGVALIVLPIAALVAAMGYLIRGFAMMFDIILGKGDGVASTLVTLGAAMFAIGIAFVNPIVLLGMAAFSFAIMGIATAMGFLPEKKVITFATISENLVKLGKVEGSNKAIEQSTTLIKAINDVDLSIGRGLMLEKILKAAIPQQQAAQATASQSAPIIKVFIGDKEIQGLITKVQTGSNLPIAANGATTR